MAGKGLVWDTGWIEDQLERQAVSTFPTATSYGLFAAKPIQIPAGITLMMVELELYIITTGGAATYVRSASFTIKDDASLQNQITALVDYFSSYENGVVIPGKISVPLIGVLRPGEKRNYSATLLIGGSVANSVVWSKVRFKGYRHE